MAAEMPPRVLPADGAREHVFPWTEATTMLEAINAAAATLDDHSMWQRPPMEPNLDQWTGQYRTDFDTAYSEKTLHADDLYLQLTSQASLIVGAAEAANTAQRRLNEDAAELPLLQHGEVPG